MTSPKNFQSKKAVSAVPGMRPKTSNNKSKNLVISPIYMFSWLTRL